MATLQASGLLWNRKCCFRCLETSATERESKQGYHRMILESIQIGKPQELGRTDRGDPEGKPWVSAIFKEPVSGAVGVTRGGLEGDGQADLRVHGGPDKAICAYPSEHLAAWASELGHAMPAGAFGENFTLRGLLEAEVCVGDIFRLGGLRLQVSQPREPCWKLARRWSLKDFPARVIRTGRTGWYFRVLDEGVAEAGLPFELESRPPSAWSLAEANRVMHVEKRDAEGAAELAQQTGLSESWQKSLRARLER